MAKTSPSTGFITRVSFISSEKKTYFALFSRDLAIAIHNEERLQYRQAQLQQEQRYARGNSHEKASKKSGKKNRRSHHDDEYDSGCILS